MPFPCNNQTGRFLKLNLLGLSQNQIFAALSDVLSGLTDANLCFKNILCVKIK